MKVLYRSMVRAAEGKGLERSRPKRALKPPRLCIGVATQAKCVFASYTNESLSAVTFALKTTASLLNSCLTAKLAHVRP